MSYTAAQYAAQQRVMALIRWSFATGLCPVCKQTPVGVWPDGAARGTCSNACQDRWLNVRPPAHQPTTDNPLGAVAIVFGNQETNHA